MWKELKNYWKLYELENRKKKSWEFYFVIRVWWPYSLSLETNIIPTTLEINWKKIRENYIPKNSPNNKSGSKVIYWIASALHIKIQKLRKMPD